MQKPRRYYSRNLQHEFSSHAPDFGVTGNWNKAAAQSFQQAIENHAAGAGVVILGTFRGTIAVTHYFNPANQLWAAFDRSGMFIAGWKLYPSQVVDLLTRGNVK